MGCYEAMFFTDENNTEDALDINHARMSPGTKGELVFHADKFITKEEMWEDIKVFIDLLMKYDYTCQVYAEDHSIIVITYAHDERVDYWGGPSLIWASEEELEILEQYRDTLLDDLLNKKENDCENERDFVPDNEFVPDEL